MGQRGRIPRECGGVRAAPAFQAWWDSCSDTTPVGLYASCYDHDHPSITDDGIVVPKRLIRTLLA